MYRKIFSRSLFFTVMLGLVIAAQPVDVFAWGRSKHHSGTQVVVVKGQNYKYYGGRFYRSGLFGLEIALLAPPIGAVVSLLPQGYKRITVGRNAYYYYDNIYYTACPQGYVVVPAPVVSANTIGSSYVNLSGETVTINVPASNGGYVPVTLIRYNNGYIGPQGEYYSGDPTIRQLAVLYGR